MRQVPRTDVGIGPDLRVRIGHPEKDCRDTSNDKIDRRACGCDLRVSSPIRRQSRLGLIENRDSADGQQHNGSGRDSGMSSDQRVAKFVEDHRAKDDGHERSSAPRVHRYVRCLLAQADECQEEEERKMNPNIDAEDAPCRNGPASHSLSCNLIRLDGGLRRDVAKRRVVRSPSRFTVAAERAASSGCVTRDVTSKTGFKSSRNAAGEYSPGRKPWVEAKNDEP